MEKRRVSISRIEGDRSIWAGDGYWDGESIQDCPAVLGDDVYDALDDAVAEAISDGQSYPITVSVSGDGWEYRATVD
jgi:hypothetical protein